MRVSCRLLLAVQLIASVGGCNRGFYRRTADRDAYCLIGEKGSGPTWQVQPEFNVEPDTRSRFYDPTCKTDPLLPGPAPQLHNYRLPMLSTRAPAPRELGDNTTGSDPQSEPQPSSMQSQDTATEQPQSQPPSQPKLQLSPQPSAANSEGASLGPLPANGQQALSDQVSGAIALRSLPPPPSSSEAQSPPVVTASAQAAEIVPAAPIDTSDAVEELRSADASASLMEPLGQAPLPKLGPVPQEAWATLPESCLKRMLEFESVRDEYSQTFGRPVDASQLDPAERVNLENILEIALINSRDYQTRKETLYRVALRLSLQRFDYDLKFLSRGNGASLQYTHDRNAGIEVNRLGVPTGVGITRSLYTGGDFIARFANDVVLTFNGPSGFSSSVGSELFIDLFQPILQRDIQFEPLTQAERDVVYAARDFVRFRKTLFRDLASQYYSLLLTYRGIAINTQDYFSNLREFNRAAATERAGQIPLFQVDQFEQNALRSRGNLINSCNALEGAIDRLKVRIGLPTELPLNVALSELEELTLRDEASVLREQLARKSRVFLQIKERGGTAGSIPALTEVARRLLSLAEVNERIQGAEPTGEDATHNSQAADLRILVALLEAEEKRIEARENELVLEKNARAGDDEAQVLPAQLFIRNKEVVRLTLDAVRQELLLLQFATQKAADSVKADDAQVAGAQTDGNTVSEAMVQDLIERWQREVSEFAQLDARLANVPFAQQAAMMTELISSAQLQLAAAKQLDRDIARALADLGIRISNNEAELAELVATVLQLRDQTPGGIGLAALDVDMDEAMLTALVQRLDLMNRRGQLADAWRLIKYAGDDLRSILNLRATQSIRTPAGSNDPFDFSFKDSTTRLSLDFDTPLNRRGERNAFRLALINYNVALRNLIEAQDTVKLDIRDELRAIELDRNQYEIAIASAALAYDRVVSTRMQVALAKGNVSARDFLEAQQAYTQSLSSVAQQHIAYIVDRIQLFLDLEQLQVDAVNFWPELRNESYPFIPGTDFRSVAPDGYGRLPCGPWYSDCIRRMEQR